MTFTDEIYEIENRARKYICDILDKNSKVELARPIDEGDIFDSDEWDELPIQYYTNKYGEYIAYHIVELYKDDEGYFAKGYDHDDGYYEFNLFETVDSIIITELADLIVNRGLI